MLSLAAGSVRGGDGVTSPAAEGGCLGSLFCAESLGNPLPQLPTWAQQSEMRPSEPEKCSGWGRPLVRSVPVPSSQAWAGSEGVEQLPSPPTPALAQSTKLEQAA